MYLIPFWDWMPTVPVHQYYCAKESGIWVYKTVDQWKAENPGVMETLAANEGVPSMRDGDETNFTDTYVLNMRIVKVVQEHRISSVLPIFGHEQDIVDKKNSEVLARYVDYSTSHERQAAGWSGWKFWLDARHCAGGGRDQSLMRQFKNRFRGAEK